MLDAWAYLRRVRLWFIQSGKPVETAYMESFNGRFPDECSIEHLLIDIAHVRRIIEDGASNTVPSATQQALRPDASAIAEQTTAELLLTMDSNPIQY